MLPSVPDVARPGAGVTRRDDGDVSHLQPRPQSTAAHALRPAPDDTESNERLPERALSEMIGGRGDE